MYATYQEVHDLWRKAKQNGADRAPGGSVRMKGGEKNNKKTQIIYGLNHKSLHGEN